MAQGLPIPRRLQGVKKAAHRRAPSQERETAKRLGGKVTPASGAFDVKGDVRVDRVMRVECKVTEKGSYALKRETLRKIADAGMGAGEIPCMDIEFIDSKGRVDIAVAVVPRWVLDLIAKRANE